ncbi:MAG: amidohydrolase [Halioglobus sp.]
MSRRIVEFDIEKKTRNSDLHIVGFTIVFLCLGFFTACSSNNDNSDIASLEPVIADLVLTGGKVYTVNSEQPWAEAVAIKGDTLIFVGSTTEAEAHIGSETRVADLDGRMVLPGFIDTHAHPMQSAGLVYALQLDSSMSLADIQEAVASYAEESPGRALLLGFGYGEFHFGSEGPTKEMLDAAVIDRPVLLIDEGGHSAWANTRALEVFGIDASTPDPIPGKHYYRRDSEGNLTGSMVESQTFFPLLAAFGAYDSALALKGGNLVYFVFRVSGVTTVFDAGMSAFEQQALEVAAQLAEEGRLPFRLVASHMIQNPDQVPGAIARFRDLEAKYNRGLLKMGGVKIHNDGTIEARNAAMLEPYTDEPGNSGAVLLEADALEPFVVALDAAGIDIMIHTIGDRAVREALDAMESAYLQNPNATTRHTLTHLEQVSDIDLPRFAQIPNLIAQTTPFWHSFSEESVVALGAARADRYHRYRQLLDGGVRVTFGSDFPATGDSPFDMAPLRNIEVGHTRQPIGEPDARILGDPGERLSIETLVRGYTLDAAYQLRMENQVGSLEVGKQADLVILDKDIFAVPAHEIHQIRVETTMLAGEVIFGGIPAN